MDKLPVKIKILPLQIFWLIVLFFLGVLLWWSPDYFKADKFFSIGDSLFPFHLQGKVIHDFYSWQEDSNSGLGSAPLPRWGVLLVFYWFLSSLGDLGMPLWLINRLYFLLPTLLLIYSAYYLAVYNLKHRYKYFAAALAAFFLVTSPPQAHLALHIDIALSGFILTFAALQRYLDAPKKHHVLIFAAGFFLMFSMPRYSYLVFIFCPLYIFVWLFFNKKRIKDHSKTKTITTLVALGLLCLGLNLYTLFPSTAFLWESASSEFMPSSTDYDFRINEIVNTFSGKTGALYTLRLILNHPMSYATYYSYGILAPLSMLIPFIMGLGLYWGLGERKSNSSHIPTTCLLFIFATMCSVFFGTSFYRFLIVNVPGFWVLNNPNYFLAVTTVFAIILFAYITSEVLEYAASKSQTGRKKVIIPILMFGFMAVVIFHNGSSIFDRIPEPRQKYSANDKKYSHAMGQHSPYFSIPKEYQEIDRLIARNKTGRILILPYFKTYTRYKWFQNLPMPEILNSLTRLKRAGSDYFPPQFVTQINNLITDRDGKRAVFMLKRYRFDYIFVHKDLLPVSGTVPPWQEIAAVFESEEDIQLLADNNYFRFYSLKRNYRPLVESQL